MKILYETNRKKISDAKGLAHQQQRYKKESDSRSIL